ncbi:MAG: helix-turn-helix transcriptional regulator [bacterium]|nr:helix-turn-helix transcriptional regulator [bacterium]
MLTSLGKFLRKLRIDRGEILRDMADKLGVTVSFLSAVENGKKRMPSLWNNRICELYSLDIHQQESFTKAIAETEDTIEMNLTSASANRRELAIAFARSFHNIDTEQITAIHKILQKRKQSNDQH